MSAPFDTTRSAGAAFRDGWQPFASAPFDRDLELAVIDPAGIHALVFACRRISDGWVNARTNARVEVQPTHWREWTNAP